MLPLKKAKDKRFVQVPDMKDKIEIDSMDYWIYANIRKFINKDTYEAHPSLLTLVKIAGVSKETIVKSIKKLVDINEIKLISQKGSYNIYKFNKLSKFEMFSFDFLENPELTIAEKKYIMVLQFCMFKNQDDDGMMTGCMSTEELSKLTNMSQRSVQRMNKNLIDKGVMTSTLSKYIKDEAGFYKSIYQIDLEIIEQLFLFQQQQINDLQTRISNLESVDSQTLDITDIQNECYENYK